jgi:DNA repair protein RadA/Sms
VALAVAGAAQNEPLATGLVAVGEVGLAGDIRRVTATSRRLAEAARLGFTHALVPPDPGRVPPGITAIEVTDLSMALRVAFPGAEVIPFGNRRAP